MLHHKVYVFYHIRKAIEPLERFYQNLLFYDI